MNGWVDFYRNWNSYKLGFGDINGEHWLGNDKLVYLLAGRHNELRIDLESASNEVAYAMYGNFSVGDKSTGYRLQVSGYSGTAGKSSVFICLYLSAYVNEHTMIVVIDDSHCIIHYSKYYQPAT